MRQYGLALAYLGDAVGRIGDAQDWEASDLHLDAVRAMRSAASLDAAERETVRALEEIRRLREDAG